MHQKYEIKNTSKAKGIIMRQASRTSVRSAAVALAALAFTARTSQASLVIYDGFNYGASDTAASGLSGGGDTGLSGTWVNQVAGGTAGYKSAGLSFSNLAVTGGAFDLAADASTVATISRQHSAGFTGDLWGSYLFKPVSQASVFSAGGLMNVTTANATDSSQLFMASGSEYAMSYKGAVRAYNRQLGTAASGSTAIPLNETDIVLFHVSNLGPSPLGAIAITEWILTAAQFDYFKANTLDEASLNAATVAASGVNTIRGKSSVSSSTNNVTFKAGEYLSVEYFGLHFQLDEVRISNATTAATGLAEVTPIPEPASLGLLALGGTLMISGGRRKR